MNELTAQQLRELLNYDPETGEFTRRVVTCNKVKVGDVAGSRHHSGYVHIRVLGVIRLAHRLAVLYMTGAWPADQVDHISGDRADNRWRNLRDVAKTTNLENQRAAHENNGSRLLGVSFDPRLNKYRAQIQTNKRKLHLGVFDTAEQAHSAYLLRKRAIHAGCTV